MSKDIFRNCCVCKKPIIIGQKYYNCSVSTCNKKSNPQIYCSVQCWDVHIPIMNHKSAWACEEIAVSNQKIIKGESMSTTEVNANNAEKETLVVVSKLKQYIKTKSDCNTSANVADQVSDIVRDLCNKAIDNAKSEGRKTVMDRDFR